MFKFEPDPVDHLRGQINTLGLQHIRQQRKLFTKQSGNPFYQFVQPLDRTDLGTDLGKEGLDLVNRLFPGLPLNL